MIRRALAFLVALVALPVALAAPITAGNAASHSLDFMIREIETGILPRPASGPAASAIVKDVSWVGSKVKYLGKGSAILGGSMLVADALKWAYDQALQDVSPDLRECLTYTGGRPSGGIGTLDGLMCGETTETDTFKGTPGRVPNPGEGFYWYYSNSNFFRVSASTEYGDSGPFTWYTGNYSSCRGGSQIAGRDSAVLFSLWSRFFADMQQCVGEPVKVPISVDDYIRGDSQRNIQPHPNLIGDIGKARDLYIERVPPYSRPGTDSSANPWPGIILNPAPTPDQLEDGNPDNGPVRPVTTTTTTTRNPDGSTTRTTTTTYSDGSKKIVKITTATTTTTNPDGSKTTTTTTTTETNNLGPDGTPEPGSPKTTTETTSETTPAPEPKPDPETPEDCSTAGGTWNPDTSKCENVPPEDPEDDKDKDPGDTCGDFQVKRLMFHPGPYIRDIFIPCDDFSDLVAPIVSLLKTKFPFSLASSLSGWFDGASSVSGSTTALPSSIGPIPIDAGWLSPLWSLIKTLVGVALYAWFVYWLIDRFAPRTQI